MGVQGSHFEEKKPQKTSSLCLISFARQVFVPLLAYSS